MADETEWYGELTLPALLRAARSAYGAAIRSALAEAGCDDVPRNGSYVIGAIARTGEPLSDIIQWLGVSKQAAGQLVDTLVIRGFLGRSVDPDDRRRTILTVAPGKERLVREGLEKRAGPLRRVLDALTPSQREGLIVGLEALAKEMSAPAAAAGSEVRHRRRGRQSGLSRWLEDGRLPPA